MNLHLPGVYAKSTAENQAKFPAEFLPLVLLQKLKENAKRLWAKRIYFEKKLDRLAFLHPVLAYLVLLLAVPVGMLLVVTALTVLVMLPVGLIFGF